MHVVKVKVLGEVEFFRRFGVRLLGAVDAVEKVTCVAFRRKKILMGNAGSKWREHTPEVSIRDTNLESGPAEKEGRGRKLVGRTLCWCQLWVIDLVFVHGERNLQMASSDSDSPLKNLHDLQHHQRMNATNREIQVPTVVPSTPERS